MLAVDIIVALCLLLSIKIFARGPFAEHAHFFYFIAWALLACHLLTYALHSIVSILPWSVHLAAVVCMGMLVTSVVARLRVKGDDPVRFAQASLVVEPSIKNDDPMRLRQATLLAKPIVKNNDPVRSATLQDCKDIIETKPLHNLKNALSQNESRARPNQRLKLAFGVNNCFTTSDKARCTEFRNIVEPLLRADIVKWRDTATRVKQVAKHELSCSETKINFSACVRMITMKTVMRPLFGFDTNRHDIDDSIRQMAEEINKQWVKSKNYDTSADNLPDWAYENRVELRQAIKTVSDNLDVDAGQKEFDKQLLNRILPSYETVWRVVLRCFLELIARGHPQANVWCNSLQAFSSNPTRDQLEDKAAAGAIIPCSDIAREALRLYPPTRRIHREYQEEIGGTTVSTQVAADIEAMQRDVAAWGPDPLMFRPERWQDIGYEERDAPNFLPFGYLPFACPARKRHGNGELPFGVSIIALFVGALVAETSGKWEIIGSLPAVGVPLDTDRESLEDLVLRRMGVVDGCE